MNHPICQVDGRHKIVLAHELLHAIYTHFPEEFKSALLGKNSERNAVAEYWAGIRADDPRFATHPVRQIPNYQTLAIPCLLLNPLL